MLLQPIRDFLYHWLNLGQYGVFVFFLVSGYIVPASLERRGSVRSFWIGRAFRLYPLYALAVILALIAWRTGYGSIYGGQHHPSASVASQLLMLSNVLSGPNVPNVVWTLSYEMVFYLLLTALFTLRAHRFSGGYAVTFAVAAVALGGILPMSALRRGVFNPVWLDLIADALVLIGIALAVTGRRAIGAVGAALAALTGLTLLTVNQGYPFPWSGYTILALMFTGTLIYRAEQGQVRWRPALTLVGTVIVLTVAAGAWHHLSVKMGPHDQAEWQWQWATSIIGAFATFAIGMLARHRKIPPVLSWLGLISYSVYLLHPLLLNAYRSIRPLHHPHPLPTQFLIAAVLIAVLLACCSLTYLLVEAPMQRRGHRLARALQQRRQPVTEVPQVAVESGLTFRSK